MRKKNKGVSITEILIVVAIASIVILGTSFLYIGQQRFSVIQDRKAKLQREMRFAMELMVKDIRMAGYNSNLDATGSFGITSSVADEIHYTIDENDDGILDDGEEHRFWLNGTILQYTKNAIVGEANGNFTWKEINPVAVGIEFTNLTLTYIDTDIDTEYDKIDISLTGRLALPFDISAYETQTLIGEVSLRNKI